VLDTSCVGALRLAAANRAAGNVVALTGEGADEGLAGYVWFKWHRVHRAATYYSVTGGRATRDAVFDLLIGGGGAHRPAMAALGGVRVAQQISWEIMAQSRERLYAPELWKRLDGYSPYDDVHVPADRFQRWHPLNQSLYAAYQTLLPGMLLGAKGDRVTRQAATEGRYPFLDERVVDFCAGLAPEYKL